MPHTQPSTMQPLPTPADLQHATSASAFFAGIQPPPMMQQPRAGQPTPWAMPTSWSNATPPLGAVALQPAATPPAATPPLVWANRPQGSVPPAQPQPVSIKPSMNAPVIPPRGPGPPRPNTA
eukprot:gene3786-biopygen3710